MQEVSEYLAEASGTLIEYGATIDKYIGDAIMAMWNAPVDQENHVELACRAVLKTAAAIDSLNDRRTAEGRAPFRTRFGLHVGEVVVGNVGSDERMNDTALGETVNLAYASKASTSSSVRISSFRKLSWATCLKNSSPDRSTWYG